MLGAAVAPTGRAVESVNATSVQSSVVDAFRVEMASLHKALARLARRTYAVDVEETVLGGVRVEIVRPSGGVLEANRHRVLINLHGGAFVGGAEACGLVESIPLSVVMGAAFLLQGMIGYVGGLRMPLSVMGFDGKSDEMGYRDGALEIGGCIIIGGGTTDCDVGGGGNIIGGPPVVGAPG